MSIQKKPAKRPFGNYFSWSISRSNLFNECKRKYFYNYYGYWDGWSTSAKEPNRSIYVLKNLQNRFQIKGKLIHDEIQKIIQNYRKTGEWDNIKIPLQRIKNRLQESYIKCKTKSYWNHNNSLKSYSDSKGDPILMFQELEYDRDLSKEGWSYMFDEIKKNMVNFYKSFIVEELSKLNRNCIVEVDRKSEAPTFKFFNEDIYSILDLLYEKGKQTIIVDWKTGKGEEEHKDQALVYALYANNHLHKSPESVRYFEYNLERNDYREYTFTHHDIQRGINFVKDNINMLKSHLSDPDNNIALIEDHPMTEDKSKCTFCNFNKVCYPEG